MRKLAPYLDLRGDIRRAKAWIPWAQKQLKRLKDLNATNVVNQVFRPIRGCAVYVRSVNDFDFIRIIVLLAKGECNLTATYTPTGSNQVDVLYEYVTDDGTSNWACYVDTGGINLPGNNRYFSNSFNPAGIINTTKTFLAPGDYTLHAVAQTNEVLVSHSASQIGLFEYEVVMDVSSIAPKASLLVSVVASPQVEMRANGVLLCTFNDGTRRVNYFSIDVDVVDSMTMNFLSLSGILRIAGVAIKFRQYDCLAQDTQTITVT